MPLWMLAVRLGFLYLPLVDPHEMAGVLRLPEIVTVIKSGGTT